MNFFLLLVFYTFVGSAVFTAGIGFERLYIHSKGTKGLKAFFIKNGTLTLTAVTLLYFFNRYALKPIGASFLLAVFTVAVLVLQEFFFNKMIEKYKPDSFGMDDEHEKVFSYGLVFFVLYETGSYLECLAAVFASYGLLFVFSNMLYILKRKRDYEDAEYRRKTAALTLITIGLVTAAFALMDTAWIFELFFS